MRLPGQSEHRRQVALLPGLLPASRPVGVAAAYLYLAAGTPLSEWLVTHNGS
jgi:hypothetical protein